MTKHYDEAGACRACGMSQVSDPTLRHYSGVDPCLGLIPDAVQACCGHAGEGDPYVVIAPGNAPGTMIPDLVGRHFEYHGAAALRYFDKLGIGPPCTHEVSLDNEYTRMRKRYDVLYADIGFGPASPAATA